ncbi:MAG TPA: hypothetical protein DIT57_09985 [Enterococcus sp.]|nr:hypothetical protein BH748_01100 [Enterococcus casseliflavus]HCO72410.1 hypothetical protein [Enterococcus sp.]
MPLRNAAKKFLQKTINKHSCGAFTDFFSKGVFLGETMGEKIGPLVFHISVLFFLFILKKHFVKINL